jgi:peptide deformylase
MAKLALVKWPDPRLKEVSKPVKEITAETRSFIDDMVETMYAENGIGLSAVQVGRMERIVTMDLGSGSERYDTEEVGDLIVMINPEIKEFSEEEMTFKEGCLSFPGQFSDVVRPEKVTVEFLDYNGKKQILHANDLLSICIQHEIDHLNGIVFVDHISKLKRERLLKKLKKADL